MTRRALLIEYDGTDFVGWQLQANGRSVQGELEKAFAASLGEKVRVCGAGRTDSGVHARGQVAHCDLKHRVPPEKLPQVLNRVLPPDVRVLVGVAVPARFNARRDARLRRYVYEIVSGGPMPAIARQCLAWTPHALDVAAMAAAAACWLGRHDFSSFRTAGCVAESPVRTLARCDVEEIHHPLQPARRVIRFTVESRSFLRSQVRLMVGTLLAIGRGAAPVSWAAEVLAAKSIDAAGPLAPAAGLALDHIDYDPPLFDLARAFRAGRSRRREP